MEDSQSVEIRHSLRCSVCAHEEDLYAVLPQLFHQQGIAGVSRTLQAQNAEKIQALRIAKQGIITRLSILTVLCATIRRATAQFNSLRDFYIPLGDTNRMDPLPAELVDVV